MKPSPRSTARLALFLAAAAALAAAFAAVVRVAGVRSPLGIVALLAIEAAAIAMAVAFHLAELPGSVPRAGRPAERAYADVDDL